MTLHGLDIMQTDRRAHRNLGKSACSHWLETLTDPVHWTGQGDIRPPYPLSRESVCHIVLAALKKEGRTHAFEDDDPRHTAGSPGTIHRACCALADTKIETCRALVQEGFEEQALEGLGLNRHAPRWILVEANDPDAISRLLGQRYDFVTALSHHDWLYRLKQ